MEPSETGTLSEDAQRTLAWLAQQPGLHRAIPVATPETRTYQSGVRELTSLGLASCAWRTPGGYYIFQITAAGVEAANEQYRAALATVPPKALTQGSTPTPVKQPMEWEERGKGTPESPKTWVSNDGRTVIEKHPLSTKYMIKRNGFLRGFEDTLDAAKDLANRLATEPGQRTKLPAGTPAPVGWPGYHGARTAPRQSDLRQPAQALARFLRDAANENLADEWLTTDEVVVTWPRQLQAAPSTSRFEVIANGTTYIVTVRQAMQPGESAAETEVKK